MLLAALLYAIRVKATIDPSSMIARIRAGTLSRDQLMIEDGMNWLQKYMSVITNDVNDPNRDNKFIVSSKDTSLKKETILTAQAMNVLKDAEEISISYDKVHGIPAPFPYFISTFQKIKKIYLKNLSIPEAISKITQLKNLEEAELHSCVLSNFTCFLPAGCTIKRLILHDCKINFSIFENNKAQNLESIVINHCNIHMVNKEIFTLPKLKKINLQNNHIDGMPVFLPTDLPITEELDLSKNNFREFPSCINSFKKLKKLNISRNQIDSFDKNFKFAPDLALEFLSLEKNFIGNFKDSLEVFKLSKLNELNLASNLLSNIEASILQISSLKKLNLSFNKVKKLTESLSLLSRGMYSVFGAIPANAAKNLQELNLSYNFLFDLPQSFEAFTSLKVLNLEGNEFKQIPEPIFRLSYLESLDLSFNKLTVISPRIIELGNLHNLVLTGGNNFRFIAGTTNNIKYVPKSIIDSPNQRVIKITLKGNNLEKDSTLSQFGETDLKRLYPDWIVF